LRKFGKSGISFKENSRACRKKQIDKHRDNTYMGNMGTNDDTPSNSSNEDFEPEYKR
jgi:hypothetical protein